MAFGINKLHKYAGTKNWLLVDRNGNFQEIRETVFDALFEQYASGYACKLDIIHGRSGSHVYFHDLNLDETWPIASFLASDTGWQAKVINNLPEGCKLSSEAKAELIDRLSWYETVTFYFL